MSLWNPLRRLLGETQPGPPPAAPIAPQHPPAPRAPPEPPSGATDAAPEALSAADADAAAGAGDLDLHRQVTAQLLSCAELHGGPASAAEQAVIERLAVLAGGTLQADLVPRLPSVLPRLMGLARREETAPRELAEIVSRDPALVGEVVRLANSPYYRRAREIDDLQGAVLVLGQTGLLQLVTRVAARPIFNLAHGRFGHHAGGLLWELTERGAHACAFLRSGHADAFAAYLAGMGAGVGFIAAVRVLDQAYLVPQAPASAAFHDALWQQAAALSLQAARQWDFPDAALQALAQRAAAARGGAQAPEPGGLARALQAAEHAAQAMQLGWPAGQPARAGSDDEARARAELERAGAAPGTGPNP